MISVSSHMLYLPGVQAMIALQCTVFARQTANNQSANLKSYDKGLTTKLPKVIFNNLQFCLLCLVVSLQVQVKEK